VALTPTIASADGGATAGPIVFDDITLTPAAGFNYRRAPSATKANWDAVKIKPFMSFAELNATPNKWRGAPGVALGDFDGDGDLDVYVTNGPGRANSLYKSLLVETGTLKYVDVATTAGVDATDMDSTGVCFGDIDNDGDEDIYVLGRMEPNRLFENQGNGQFHNITGPSNAGAGVYGHVSCSMGDVNGDGLLDIFVGNLFDQARFEAIYNDYFALNHPNQLLVNQGGNTFADASNSSGIRNLYNVPPGDATITWAVALVDFDQDGDLDIFQADDQGALAPGVFAGVDRGYVQVFKNDGAGHFTNATKEVGTNKQSSWMGLAFGDLNGDGRMDFFATSTGDYMVQQFGVPIPPDLATSRWFLGIQSPSGKFEAPPAPPSAFGWSASLIDYDNDGDTDVTYYGGLNVGPFISTDNPGVILENDGNANLRLNLAPTAQTHDKVRRSDCNSMATGDLNNDGYPDIVHVSGHYVDPAKIPLVPMHWKWAPFVGAANAPFDDTALYAPTFFQVGPMEWEWTGKEPDEGMLGVQISNAATQNSWVKIGVKGTKDLTTRGKTNRDGIGAVVRFTPRNGKIALSPVTGGSGSAGQHSLIQSFGLGKAQMGVAEVLWPGGVRNRLYNVTSGESVTIPEIGCSFSNWSGDRQSYKACVNGAIDQLYFREVITADLALRLRVSALRAYDETH
jgi:hypothetical protein